MALHRPVTKRKIDSSFLSVLIALKELVVRFLSILFLFYHLSYLAHDFFLVFDQHPEKIT
ncbi:hypothetical protein M092_3617 [Parabacteroides distasonis str. 3776 D15 iv]|nr:hypothetical protein HMPREF0104_00337 [Bacteroides sp. 3_1_19]KDS45159.1 hypothetical protein M090_4271 [Parabacteroides distasonis str. 3776 Po2 i]KDS67766.1 hypothetical protein M095_2147 [Parabacteroides distasonis str. 3999B T(B) 4]KDS69435.1 hypothetical protein M092_3617 [Parabacteroides distasonis str. 3776 D15 iv]KDS75399.1 hypothetical protein M096_2348 [Parabacteroides distasonis str. 3999B T(B) 6]